MGKQIMTVAENHTPRTADTSRISLLDRIGGPVAVDLIVDRLIDALTNDPHVASCLEGVDLGRLRRAQMHFFVEAFGGAGSSPWTPTPVRVDGEALVRVVIHLHDVIDSLGVPEPLAEQLMLAVAAKVLADGQPAASSRNAPAGPDMSQLGWEHPSASFRGRDRRG